MNNFSFVIKNKVFDAINKYNMLSKTETVVVGFSGGADSVCLLHFLNTYKNELNINLKAVHVNHGIRGDEANRDEAFAVDFCSRLGIECVIKYFNCVELSAQTKESLEECGRRIRYRCFNQVAYGGKIATAHNANDNAETLIFNLSRGASLKGVCGIPAVRDNVIRPLIFCTRAEIEGYCKENNLIFMTDSTNLSDEYTRNKIRHNILPVMEEVNSSAVSNVSAFCEQAKDIYDYIHSQANTVLNNAYLCDNTYDVHVFKELHKALLSECISISYNRFSGKVLERKKVQEITKLLYSNGRLQLYGDEYAESFKNRLRFYHASATQQPDDINVKMQESVTFGDFTVFFSKFTDCSKNKDKNLLDNLIDCDKIVGDLILRTRREGDKISLHGRNVSKTLKKLFNELSVPVEIRDFLPVLADDNGIVWVYGVGTASRCRATAISCNIMLVEGKNNG